MPVPGAVFAGEAGPSAGPRPHLLSALPDFALSAAFFAAWLHPERTSPAVLGGMVLTMLLEFVVVHSSGFMGVMAFGDGRRGGRMLAVVGLGALYTIFVAGFCLGFHTWWPLGSFWLLTLNRALGILLGAAPSGREQALIMTSWAVTTLFYLVGAVVTAAAWVPRLGFTPAVVTSMHLAGGGVWVDEPWRPIAFGGFYYAAVGLFELSGWLMFRGRR